MSSSRKPRVVVDTNVFISGALFHGYPGCILDQINRLQLELLMSPDLEGEILRVLSRFQVPIDVYRDIHHTLKHHIVRIMPQKIALTSRDPKDDMLLALSLAGHADYLITGDKDLLVLRAIGDTNIVTPKQFIHIHRSQDSRKKK